MSSQISQQYQQPLASSSSVEEELRRRVEELERLMYSNQIASKPKQERKLRKYNSVEEAKQAQKEHIKKWNENKLKEDPYYFSRRTKKCPLCIYDVNNPNNNECAICKRPIDLRYCMWWNCLENKDPQMYYNTFFEKLVAILQSSSNFTYADIDYYNKYIELLNRPKIQL